MMPKSSPLSGVYAELGCFAIKSLATGTSFTSIIGSSKWKPNLLLKISSSSSIAMHLDTPSNFA